MATIANLQDPISLERTRNPVISEKCFHTFQRSGISGTLYTDLESRLGNWDLRVPHEYECALCKEKTPIEQIVTNDAWVRLNTLIDRYIRENKKKDQKAEDFESEIEGMEIAELYAWELEESLKEIRTVWKKEHTGGKWGDLKVVDFLKWKEDPLVKKLFDAWKEEHPTKFADHLHIDDLFLHGVEAKKKKKIDVLKDIRPSHLLGFTAEDRDEEKIKASPSRAPSFSSESWSTYESLKFIVSSIYNFTLALLFEVGLYLLYFWECGFLTKKQYTDLRAQHVIHRVMPLYLQYMGLPTEKPVD
ncbi:MAG: hypothetical protein KDK61_00835 [Simkania sp.]|nr:hypothetical protein [Simkania sp.]MCB1082830.1 hypothetical protein [Simkania sp.]MCP5489555.1 hypothetical protein [Chlamydiales bacterium]